ncbi:retrograde regulation protein 2 [Knufia obscura]|uniref:Retrograde regulation protein 2 n=1 Tax=Knufia obscura TaxID=1635080 RepID=A0ABR0S0W5_9EURO|nr:retrograde regulation protein 2 [Knufia obscura]
MAGPGTDQLYALVDMAPPTTRSLPTVYQSRLGISLYDAQYADGQKVPIPRDTIATILSELKRFKQTSLDFGVPQQPENIRILATEATRNAINSSEFIGDIEKALGEPWKVNILAKEDEGRIGALGVVSSVGGSDGLQGLMMDLGGGSTQITWLIARPGEPMQTTPLGSISFPYGAAAMTRLLEDTSSNSARVGLCSKIVEQFKDAYQQLSLPHELLRKTKSHGLTLYLSGGGFRGWGYLLMSSHRVRPYPIPIINGFSVPVKDFKNTSHVSDLASKSLTDRDKEGLGVFRVSKRRAAQVPAVSFLIDALIEAIPVISEVRFCQGGVREGWLFDTLPSHIRAQDPLVAASARYSHDAQSSKHFTELLIGALPPDCPILDRRAPNTLKDPLLLRAFANLLFLQQGHSREGAAVTALHLLVTGQLASAHGIDHEQRALLSLMLGQRWGGAGNLPAPNNEIRTRLEALLTQQEIWWARYLGVIGTCIGDVYPAGRMRGGMRRIVFEARWGEGLGKKGNMQGVILKLAVAPDGGMDNANGLVTKELVAEVVERLEEIGKKKNRVGGKEYGYGVPVRVDVQR